MGRKRLFALMGDIGVVYVETDEAVGQMEAGENHSNHAAASRLAKTILRLTAVMAWASRFSGYGSGWTMS